MCKAAKSRVEGGATLCDDAKAVRGTNERRRVSGRVGSVGRCFTAFARLHSEMSCCCVGISAICPQSWQAGNEVRASLRDTFVPS